MRHARWRAGTPVVRSALMGQSTDGVPSVLGLRGDANAFGESIGYEPRDDAERWR